jgi:hypothetical protein
MVGSVLDKQPVRKCYNLTEENKFLLYKTLLRLMDIRNPPLRHGLPIQYCNTTTLSKQSITNSSECTVVHTQQSPTHRSARINSSRRSYETRHSPQGQATPAPKSTYTYSTERTRTEKAQTI